MTPGIVSKIGKKGKVEKNYSQNSVETSKVHVLQIPRCNMCVYFKRSIMLHARGRERLLKLHEISVDIRISA